MPFVSLAVCFVRERIVVCWMLSEVMLLLVVVYFGLFVGVDHI